MPSAAEIRKQIETQHAKRERQWQCLEEQEREEMRVLEETEAEEKRLTVEADAGQWRMCKGDCGAELNRFLAGGPKLIYYYK